MTFKTLRQVITHPGTTFHPPTRQNLLLGGFLALVILLLAVVAWDAYLYYRTNVEQRLRAIEVAPPSVLPVAELEEVIRLLDEREQRYQDTIRFSP